MNKYEVTFYEYGSISVEAENVHDAVDRAFLRTKEIFISDIYEELEVAAIEEIIYKKVKEKKNMTEKLWIVTPQHQIDNEVYYFFSDPKIIEIETEDDFDFLPADAGGSFEDWEGTKWISYWDGSNWKYEWIKDVEEIEFEFISEYTPDPAFYFKKTIRIDDEEIDLILSNISPGIKPYWKKDTKDI